jgi:hypothetical protein
MPARLGGRSARSRLEDRFACDPQQTTRRVNPSQEALVDRLERDAAASRSTRLAPGERLARGRLEAAGPFEDHE